MESPTASMSPVGAEYAAKDEVASYISSPYLTCPPSFNMDEARQRIRLYSPRFEGDKTQNILTCFLDFLPNESKDSLAESITAASEAALYYLSQHLCTALLIPSQTSYPYWLLHISPEFLTVVEQ
jgi:hypothetical protein